MSNIKKRDFYDVVSGDITGGENYGADTYLNY